MKNGTVINIVSYWNKDKHVDQWNRIEKPGENPCIYGYLDLQQECQDIQNGKDSLFNIGAHKTRYPHVKKN